jgi:hypothetical protein
LSVARRGAGEQGANGANSLPVAPNDAANITLSHLETKKREAALRDLREHNLVGEFDQLPNNELEELQHPRILSTEPSIVHRSWR